MKKTIVKKVTKKTNPKPAPAGGGPWAVPAKVRVATMWLSGCSGCHMSVLDLDERLVGLMKLIDILFSPIVDTKVKDMPQVDQLPDTLNHPDGAVNEPEDKVMLVRLKAPVDPL